MTTKTISSPQALVGWCEIKITRASGPQAGTDAVGGNAGRRSGSDRRDRALIQQYQVKRLARTVAEQADIAAAAGDFQKAEQLYDQHLKVVGDDIAIKIKYADLIQKYSSTPIRQAEALEIYGEILPRDFPGEKTYVGSRWN